jgi:hypothetical protein
MKKGQPFKWMLSGVLVATYLAIVATLFIVERRTPAIPSTSTAPNASLVSAITTWSAARVIALWNLPWQWIALGAGLGAFAAFIIMKRRKCPYQWAHELADRGIDSISRDVELRMPYISNEQLRDEVPSITFIFPIFSNSLFDIAIEKEVSGHIVFEYQNRKKQKNLAGLKIVSEPSNQLVHRGEGSVVIEQRLTEEEAKLILNEEGRFAFNQLNIMLTESPKTDTAFPKVNQGKLLIPQTHRIPIREIGALEAFRGIGELSVAIAEGNCLLNHFPLKSTEDAKAAGEDTPDHLLDVWLSKTERAIQDCLGDSEVIRFQGGLKPPEYPASREDKIAWLTEHIGKLETLIEKVRARAKLRVS